MKKLMTLGLVAILAFTCISLTGCCNCCKDGSCPVPTSVAE